MAQAGRIPELLAPAGGYPQLRAAVAAGADAVYFGLSEFNARARAVNFAPEELLEVMAELHRAAMQGFVTLNTLIFDRELPRMAPLIARIAEAGVDAVIVQDLGVVQLIREIAPDLPIHASTQMTITSAESALFAQDLGVSRVVLARELSLKEIEQIAQVLQARGGPELEVFVHGALCVSYSGQCFSSEGWGGRSANRGECAQACRLPYELLCDGEVRELGPSQYLLSPQDLMALLHIPELVRSGVNCFKIEGRLKGPEYVALTAQAYRKAIDQAWAGLPVELSVEAERDINQVFSRGLTPGFLEGARHQRLVQGRAPRHRGVKVGEVIKTTERGVVVQLSIPVKPGDGLVFDQAQPQDREEGGRVYACYELNRDLVELRFGKGEVNLRRVQPGDWVWRTDDPQLQKRLRQLAESEQTAQRIPLTVKVQGQEGEPLQLHVQEPNRPTVSVVGRVPLQAARQHGLASERLMLELGKLGGTPYWLQAVEVELVGELFYPLSELAYLRREAIAKLLDHHQVQGYALSPREALNRLRQVVLTTPVIEPVLPEPTAPEPIVPELKGPELTVLCRTPQQVEAAIELGVPTIYIDYLDFYGLKPSVQAVQAAGLKAVIAAPRILKPNEERLWRFLLGLEPEGLLVRSLGLLQTLTEPSFALSDQVAHMALIGDFSLNAVNGITAKTLLAKGLQALTVSHDLSAKQILDLARYAPAQQLEVIVHHHLPVFHTEHCVFARFLSTGDDFTTCGRPCERHQVELRDRTGLAHPVVADMGCRNTVFHAQAQSGAEHLAAFQHAGIRRFRIELVHETPEQLCNLYPRYREALEGQVSGRELWQSLRQSVPQGITRGSLA
ncbi:U32 family peptidase [Leptolyngbya sp. FACHB-261]|uniref:U32 family peptidase n=1 Tax=Leptolyngbya sp. FACHB-261 TaxID=2692806 RepID=UPI0018EF992B|nr:U32 family peptidase [Leptolyngbya sp. FACHB-261]